LSAPLLSVDQLAVDAAGTCLLQPVSFALGSGDCMVIVGESGAGKSLLAQAIMGQLPAALSARGQLNILGERSLAAAPHLRQRRWGRTLALLPQEPALALSPLMAIGEQLNEVHRWVAGQDVHAAAAATRQALSACGLHEAAALHPWCLSGGMAQRAAMAVALAGGAQIVLADEPTKGLDDVWRQACADTLLGRLRQGACAVVITHDLALARQLGGRILVMQQGQVVEQGDTAGVLAAPRHAFTRALRDACPAHWPALPAMKARPQDPPLLRLQQVSKRWAGPAHLFSGLSLEVRAGERHALTGPSGCGKSTLGQIMLGLVRPDSGEVMRQPGLHPHAFQKLYQDPVKAFPVHQTLHDHLRQVSQRHRGDWTQVLHWLARLQLSERLLQRPAAQVSGGELQRVALLRALIARPAFVFADEPTSRLDPLSQQQTLALLCEVLAEREAALVLVTHDQALARAVSDRPLLLGLAGAAQSADTVPG
jgi:peptide/nickel transport system ATP-binding protein